MSAGLSHINPSKQEAALKSVITPTTPDIIERFKPSRVFKDAVDNSQSQTTEASGSQPSSRPSGSPLHVTSVAFDDMGDRCVTAGEDDVFTLYDARKGKKLRTLYSKKYGIAHARFTHRPQNIIHASTKADHAIRYHSMHDNKYLSYFQGHTDTVRSLQMSPVDDTFISAGDDQTVRLWDLRAPTCRGVINDMGGSTIAAFDSGGVVFAVACSDNQTIMLFDSASLDAVPFAYTRLVDPEHARIESAASANFTSLAFSNNGDYLLVGTASNVHYVLDAFDLVIVRRLEGHGGLDRHSGEEVCWSADSRCVFSGSRDGNIVAWDLSAPDGATKLQAPDPAGPTPTMQPSVILRPGDGQHAASRAVQFNPRYNLLAVGGEEFSMWLPTTKSAADIDEGW
ncbi:hypothetical protein Q8F55_008823 [Vanrija albida]|uniref:Anaphase-promoting complex subunit 4 WD40 domain-containing protein n=1 Tax=Vanrija albida TaxID=181172 RepID=A0ABR3PSV4_9TREE